MLQKDGFFRKRDDGFMNKGQTLLPPAHAPSAGAAPAPSQGHPQGHPEPKKEERREAKLVVGPDIKMKGVEITDCDTLVVEGRVEATLDSRVLEIAQNGVFQGTIAVDEAVIHGRFEGELTVRKQLVIQASGRVSGKVRYTKIKVEEGAELAGELSVLDKAQAAAVRRAA